MTTTDKDDCKIQCFYQIKMQRLLPRVREGTSNQRPGTRVTRASFA